MRYLYLFFLIVCFVSCKTKSGLVPANTKENSNMVCPVDGVCSFEIIKNRSLQIKTDELQGTYPEVINGNSFVLKFEYKKGNSNYQDSSYREEVFIELDKSNLEFETTDLKEIKLFFARWCYCKGQTGYYNINQGKLSITKKDDDNFELNLSFKIEEVPQIINQINYTFNLD